MTTQNAPAASEKALTTRDLRRMYWRSTFLLGSFNFSSAPKPCAWKK